MVKNWLANVGDIRDVGSILGSKRYPGEGHGNPLQYSCLENPMDRGAWQATVHGVTDGHNRGANSFTFFFMFPFQPIPFRYMDR